METQHKTAESLPEAVQNQLELLLLGIPEEVNGRSISRKLENVRVDDSRLATIFEATSPGQLPTEQPSSVYTVIVDAPEGQCHYQYSTRDRVLYKDRKLDEDWSDFSALVADIAVARLNEAR